MSTEPCVQALLYELVDENAGETVELEGRTESCVLEFSNESVDESTDEDIDRDSATDT